MENIFKLSEDGKILIKVLDKSAEHITIPDGVEIIGEQAFHNCKSLRSINIPDGVTEIGNHTFSHCSSLQNINIPDSVIEIGLSAFWGCISLQSIDIPNRVKTIENTAFRRCNALQSINVAEENQYYTSIDGVLYSKDLTIIKRVPIGAKLKTFTIPNSVTTIEYGAFQDCKTLQSINIPDSVTEIHHFFTGCTSLKNINVVSGNQHYTSIDGVLYDKELTTLMKVPAGAELKAFTIPESVTTIECGAFEDCKALQSVNIPNSVKVIEEGAFDLCESLKSIHMHSTAIEELYVSEEVFEGILGSVNMEECILYVPAGTKEVYANHPVWGNFKNIVEE